MDQTVSTKQGDVRLGDIVSIAHAAGKKIMEIYEGDQSNWQVEAKSDNSPLTVADRAANAEICSRLKELDTKFPIMSEENKQESFDERSKWQLYWCVDPLDGTKEFIKRNGEFTVNIALMEAIELENPERGAHPILGVVYAPVKEKVYFAGRKVGAHCSVGIDSSSASKITCAKFKESDAGLRIVCSRSHLDEKTQAIIAMYSNAKSVSMGSSLKFMLVAEGEAHVYPRMAPTMEWDTAASQVVVEEAGGEVLRADDKKRMYYNKEDLLNPFFICYGNRTS